MAKDQSCHDKAHWHVTLRSLLEGLIQVAWRGQLARES